MRLLDYLREAARDLRSAKLRTALTSLGIIIGVASVVLLLSLGEGVRSQIAGAFSDLGSNRVIIVPSAPGGGSGMGGAVASTFTAQDVNAIAELSDVADVASVITFGGRVSGPAGELPMAVTGSSADYFSINGNEFVAGRSMDSSQAVLNQTAAAQLLGDTALDAGAEIEIDGRIFSVSGIIADPEASPFGRRDRETDPVVVIDDDDAAELADTTHPSMISLTAADGAVVSDVVEQIKALLLERHDQLEDFDVISFEQIAASFEQITGVLTGFLAAIAAISLLVGGIGIMNIMLVVVSERTREIGIAKAIGATRRTVVTQFLVEAILLSLTGGLVGLGLAWLGLTGIGAALDLPVSISASTLSLAIGTSVGIGILFGVAPAYRAARLDPISALRHE